MELLIVIGMLPGIILFDLIPIIFGFSGLSNWYCEKYEKPADILIPFYLLFTVILLFIKVKFY